MFPHAHSQVKAAPKIGVAFAAIPLDVLRARNISPPARLAFAALANHARMRRGEVSTLTNRRLAEAAGLSIAAARRALDELEVAGLIRRLFGPSKRIRVGVAITYQSGEGCAPAASQISEVARQAQPGCSTGSLGGCAPPASDLIRGGEETPKSPSLALQEAEEQKPDGAAGAAYLRECVRRARLGLPMPEPPAGVTATKGVHETGATTPAPTSLEGAMISGTSQSPPDASGIAVVRMVADLASGLSWSRLDVRRPERRKQRPKR